MGANRKKGKSKIKPKQSEPSGLSNRPSSKVKLLLFLIPAVCIVVAFVHWPALSSRVLSFDDDQYLTENLLVQNPGWTSAKRFLTEVFKPSTVKGYYQPLTMISLMTDYALGGRIDNLVPFHRTSLFLHVANTALITILLYLLFGNIWAAAATGLLFGIHPMTVEPIAWIGERKTLLSAFFSLWCLVFYVKYAKQPEDRWQRIEDRNRNKYVPYFLSFIFYLLALLSKPTSTPLPLLMLILDYWPLKRFKLRAFIEKVPLFVIGSASAIITYISQSSTFWAVLPRQYGPEQIPLVLCHNIIFYPCKMIWPVNLSSHYAFPAPLGLSNPMVLAGVIGTCILIPVLLISLRWTKMLMAGWLFFFVAILPTMQIIRFSNVIASDKHFYLPSLGLLIILASFLKSVFNIRRIKLCIMVIIIVLILFGAEAVTTQRYLAYWRDSAQLLEHMLKLSPNSEILHCVFGTILQSQGRLEEAITHYNQALKISPYYVEAHYNLGNAYGGLGRYAGAVEEYKQVIKIRPDYAEAHCNLGIAYGQLGRYSEEVEEYKQAIKIKPDLAKAYNNLGVVYEKSGRYLEALEEYKQAIRINPNLVEVHYNLGNVYRQLDRYSEAVEEYKQVIRIKPNLAEAHYNLGLVLLKIGNKTEALEEYKTIKTLNEEVANELYMLINQL